MEAVPSPFDPLTLGPLRLRNRFIRAGANEGMVVDGAPSRALVKHHRDLAAGGVGMTTVAYGAVAKVGRTLPNQVWLRREILPDLRALAAAVHAEIRPTARNSTGSGQQADAGPWRTGIRKSPSAGVARCRRVFHPRARAAKRM